MLQLRKVKNTQMKLLKMFWLLAACCIAAVTSNPLPQSRATVETYVTNWKCPPSILRFCTLPATFPANVVSTGGVSGCVPGIRMQGNTQCPVACKAGYVPEAGTDRATTTLRAAQGSYRYSQYQCFRAFFSNTLCKPLQLMSSSWRVAAQKTCHNTVLQVLLHHYY
jgi:hypothetical protein